MKSNSLLQKLKIDTDMSDFYSIFWTIIFLSLPHLIIFASPLEDQWTFSQKNAFYKNPYTTMISPYGMRTDMNPVISIIHIKDAQIYALHEEIKKYSALSFKNYLLDRPHLAESPHQIEKISSSESVANLDCIHYRIIQSDEDFPEFPPETIDVWIFQKISLPIELKPFMDFNLPLPIPLINQFEGIPLKIIYTVDNISKTILDTTSYEITKPKKDLFKIPKSYKYQKQQ